MFAPRADPEGETALEDENLRIPFDQGPGWM